MRKSLLCVTLLVAGTGTGLMVAPPVAGLQGKPEHLASGVVPWTDAPQVFGWGEMRKAFTGETYGTKKLFVSSFVMKPGRTVHPPHQHAQEEFMTIVEGAGTWHLDGKDIPARKGDVIYVSPWTWHGLTNSGEEPLTYFVCQWNSRGLEPAPKPKKPD